MRNLRRLPPFLRVVFSVGLVCFISAFAIFVSLFASQLPWVSHGPLPAIGYRWEVLALNLIMIGVVSTTATNAYVKRFDLFPPNPLLLDSLRQQVLAVLLPSLAPLCAITLAFIISPASSWFGVVFGVSLFGAMGVLASVINLGVLSGNIFTLG